MSEIDLAAEFDAALEGKVEPAKQETAPEAKADSVAKADDSATFDINSLPPAAKSQWEATQKRLQEIEERNRRLDTENRSFRGKTPHLESKVARLERELKERALPAQVREERPGVAQSPQGQKPASTLQALPGWPKLRQIFADDAAPIEEAFTALETHNQKLSERLEQYEARLQKMDELLEKDVKPRIATVDELREFRANEQFEHVTQQVYKARESLATKYPDYQSHIRHELDDNNEIVQTHMSDQFATWIDTKPGRVKELFGPDATQEDVDYGLDLFYRDTVRQQPDPNAAKVAQLNTQRQANLQRQVAPSAVSGTVRMDAGDLTDADQFDRFLAERERLQRK